MGVIGQAVKGATMASFGNSDSLATWAGGGRSMLKHYTSDAYSSAYPSIRAISNEYMTIMPFAIDQNGKPVKHPVINSLYHPNQLDSSVSFFEKIAVSTLVLPKTYLLVWRKDGREAKPGGDFRTDIIAGFTFLEFPGITRRDGRTFYNIGSQEFNDKEVIVLPGGVNPYNLYGGYSPSEASRRWAKLDDYIADFQTGFFENNAIPAGQFIITAASKADFNDTVDMLQSKHRGAGNNSNVTYTPRPMDANGKPADAKIEWLPFAQSNKEIDFKNLFDQTNRRLDLAYGVPQIVKGVDDAATYANAQVAEKTFSKRAVYPLALRNYTQITHELNRISNGLGIAITFEYQIPTVADEEKVLAETKNIEATLIQTLTAAGYSLDSIVQAFELTNARKLLKTGTGAAKIDNDKPDVDEGGEVKISPDPEKIDGITPVNKKKKPKAELSDLQKLENITRQFMQAQVDKAIKEYKSENPNNEVTGSPSKADEKRFADDMHVVVVSIMVAQGAIEYSEGIKLLEDAGISTENLDEFILNDTARTSYQAYLTKLGQSYGADTQAAIQKALDQADSSGLNRAETEKLLKDIMNTDDWRVKRVGVTELNRSQSLSGVEAMKQIQAEAGVTLEKSLHHPQGAECEWCKALEGVWVKVDQPYLAYGETVVGVDGGLLINDFVENEGYDPHPNGKGTIIYRVVN